MKPIFVIFSILFLSMPAKAAKKDKLWYKVEEPEKKKEEESIEPYDFDSLDSKKNQKNWKPVGFWSLRPHIAFHGGFLADEKFIEDKNKNRLFFSTDIGFRNRSWHRMVAGALLTQNSDFITSASWHYTPSRKYFRAFYGGGLALLLSGEKEFRSLLEIKNFYVTGSYGWEMLLDQKSGVRLELKAYLGTSYYGVHLALGYIWHL